MRALALLPALAALAGCVPTPAEAPRDKDVRAESWVGHWDEVCERHPAQEALAPIRGGRHLLTRSLRLAAGAASELGEAAHVVIVVEGAGALAGAAGWTEPLEPGHVALIPPGGATLHASGELRALVASPRQPPGERGGAPRVLSLEELFPRHLTEPPGGMVEVGRQPGISLHAAAITKLAGLHRHAHLTHDLLLFFLSGAGTLGLGSEAGDKDNTSVGDRQLKRGYVSSPVSDRALAFLPAEAPHSYLNEGDVALLLMVYAPGFDGKDGAAIPDARPKAATEVKAN